MTRATRGVDVVIIVAFGLAGAALSSLITRDGLLASPDSWAFWEGSISLLETGRYTFLTGEPITLWVPFFPGYLAALQRVGGQTGATLGLAMTVISFANVIGWGWYVRTIFKAPRDRAGWVGFIASLAFVATFVAVFSEWLFAQSLMLVFVGAAYTALLAVLSTSDASRFGRRSLLLGAGLALALLVHNSAVVFAVAAALLVMSHRRLHLRVRGKGAVLVAVVALAPWIITRLALGQGASHPLEGGRYPPFRYLSQTLTGLGDYLLPSVPGHLPSRLAVGVVGIAVVLGAGSLLVFRKRLAVTDSCVQALLFTALAYGGLFTIFNATWIDGQLANRQLWFVPLALIPVFLRTVTPHLPVVVCVAALALATPVARSVAGSMGSAASLDRDARVLSEYYIRPWFFLTTRDSATGPRHTQRVEPPTYEWMPRWHRSPWPEDQRRRVRVRDSP